MNHLDLCSGIGGFALAARWHGMTTVGFCEIDPWCRRVLAKNFPGVPQHDDIKTLTGEHVRAWVAHAGPAVHDADQRHKHPEIQVRPRRNGAVDATLSLITGGYPCQPFSLAGKRMGSEDDRHLWPYIAALVADLRPRWCLLENVAGHISLGLDGVLSDLEEIGYTAWPVVVPACALNAPHRRDRVWILAHATDGGVRRGTAPGDTGQPARGGEVVADTRRGDGGGWSLPARWDESDGGDTGWPEGSGWAHECGETLAHATRERAHGCGGSRHGWAESANGGVTPSDAYGSGWQEQRRPVARVSQLPAAQFSDRGQTQPGLGFENDGLPRRLDERLARPWGDDWESGVPRVSDGSTDRVNKLKALGNAIVPQVAYAFIGAITEAEDGL